jgi:lipopolysaccharide export system protein LptA
LRSISQLAPWSLMLCAATAWSAPPVSAAPRALAIGAPGALAVRLRADRLALRPRERRLELRGNVELTLRSDGRGSYAAGPAAAAPLSSAPAAGRKGQRERRPELELWASRLDLELDAAGAARRLTARGTVRVALASGRGSAEELVLTLTERGRELELRRAARLELAELGLGLEGERISVDLESGRLTVLSARAKIGAAR